MRTSHESSLPISLFVGRLRAPRRPSPGLPDRADRRVWVGGVPAIVLPFRNATPGQQPLIMPGSTDAALAVKTERFPPYGLPPITARR